MSTFNKNSNPTMMFPTQESSYLNVRSETNKVKRVFALWYQESIYLNNIL